MPLPLLAWLERTYRYQLDQVYDTSCAKSPSHRSLGYTSFLTSAHWSRFRLGRSLHPSLACHRTCKGLVAHESLFVPTLSEMPSWWRSPFRRDREDERIGIEAGMRQVFYNLYVICRHMSEVWMESRPNAIPSASSIRPLYGFHRKIIKLFRCLGYFACGFRNSTSRRLEFVGPHYWFWRQGKYPPGLLHEFKLVIRQPSRRISIFNSS